MSLTIYFPPHMHRAIGLMDLIPFVRFLRITRFQDHPINVAYLFRLPLGNTSEGLWARRCMKEVFDNCGWRKLFQRAGRCLFQRVKFWRRCELNESLFLPPFLLLLCLFVFWLFKVLSDFFPHSYMQSVVRTKPQNSEPLKWAENVQLECPDMRSFNFRRTSAQLRNQQP